MRLGLAPVEADSQEALDIAVRETRAAKLQHVATSELRAGWRDEAAAAGMHPDLKEYVEHYNRARPHRSLDLRPPTGDLPDRDAQVTVKTRLGGLLREYSRAAA